MFSNAIDSLLADSHPKLLGTKLYVISGPCDHALNSLL